MTETRYLSCAETAKLIRAALKEAFPSVRFSVRSSVYSGGASIDIHYVDGPALAAVKPIAAAFEGASFDGMTDCKSYRRHTLDGERVSLGADWVFVDQAISSERQAATVAACAALDDVELNNLEAVVRMGRFDHCDQRPMTPERGWDWACFVTAVARVTLPAIAALPSPTLRRLAGEG